MSGLIDTVGSKSGIVGSDVFPAGHVIQLVEGSLVTSGLHNSTSWAEHTSATRTTITPSSTSSKIFIGGVITCYVQGGGNWTAFRRDIGGTVTMPLFDNNGYGTYLGGALPIANHGSWNIWAIDSPNTTSAVIYSLASKSSSSPYNSYTHKATKIYLMEIAG